VLVPKESPDLLVLPARRVKQVQLDRRARRAMWGQRDRLGRPDRRARQVRLGRRVQSVSLASKESPVLRDLLGRPGLLVQKAIPALRGLLGFRVQRGRQGLLGRLARRGRKAIQALLAHRGNPGRRVIQGR
jgi:hypothetical protein